MTISVTRITPSIESHAINTIYSTAGRYIFGRHELSWGGDILREQSILDQDFNSDGTFTFGGRYSGNNLVDFLYGKPSAFTQITHSL